MRSPGESRSVRLVPTASATHAERQRSFAATSKSEQGIVKCVLCSSQMLCWR